MPLHTTTNPCLPTLLTWLILASITPLATAAEFQDSFVSGGKRVRVERFEPSGGGRCAAVVLLHGLDGMEAGGKAYRFVARRLAQEGFLVILAHYLDRTGTTKEDLPALLEQFRAFLGSPEPDGERWRQVQGVFGSWLEVVTDAVGYARKHPRVDPDRVGLVGFSMGGFLAASAASRPSLRVRCVAELFGGLPRPLAGQARRMPAMLIIHGDDDKVVPLGEARALQALLGGAGRACELKVYKGVGHGFLTSNGRLDWLAMLDAEQRTFAFLASHLAAPREKPLIAVGTAGFRPGHKTYCH